MFQEKGMMQAMTQSVENLNSLLDRLEAGIAETDRHAEAASKIHHGTMETLYRLGFARPEPMPGNGDGIGNAKSDQPKLTTLQRLDQLIEQLAAANAYLYRTNEWNDNILRGALANQI